MIPGQIHFVKQVNIHMHYSEDRYLSHMYIVEPLHSRVYRPFHSGVSFVNPFCYLCFMLIFVMPSYLFLDLNNTLFV